MGDLEISDRLGPCSHDEPPQLDEVLMGGRNPPQGVASFRGAAAVTSL